MRKDPPTQAPLYLQYEIYARAKSAQAQRGIPFAFVTGYGDDKAVLGEFAGRPVLAKPFGRRALRDILRAGA